MCHEPWYKKNDWESELRPLAEAAKQSLEGIVRLLGNGSRLPASLKPVAEAARTCTQKLASLRRAYEQLLWDQHGSNAKEFQKEYEGEFGASHWPTGLVRWFGELTLFLISSVRSC
jgi:exonuclease VII small subunit